MAEVAPIKRAEDIRDNASVNTPEFARTSWSEALKMLRSSRDSIIRATDAAYALCALCQVSQSSIAIEMLNGFCEADEKRQLALVYLVDSICQKENKSGSSRQWRTAFEPRLHLLVSNGPDPSTLLKVVEVWQQRKVFPSDDVHELLRLVRQRLNPKRKPEDEYDREIAAVRREAKRARLDGMMAKAGSEFEDMWKATEKEIAASPPSVSAASPTTPPKGMISPSTPYSPSSTTPRYK